MTYENLRDSYRFHRYGKRSGIRFAVPATRALELARADVAADKRRYPSSLGNPWNRPFAAYGERHLRWIEDVDRAGLRFVGFADEIVGLTHRGWFADDYQDEVYRGAVYQLPARHGACVYAYGYDDPNNDRAALLSFDWTADKEQAARWADSLCERAAEQEREYREVFHQRTRFDDAADEATSLRKRALALIRDIKAGSWQGLPAAREELCAKVQELRAGMLELYARRARLLSEYGQHEGWQQ